MALVVLSTLRLNYPGQFKNSYPDEDTVNAAAKAYSLKLIGLTPKQILKGLDRATDRKFMPNPFEFSECCKPIYEDFGFPNPRAARKMLQDWDISRAYFDPKLIKEIDDVVYTTWKRMDVFLWKQMPKKESKQYFDDLYSEVISDFSAGIELYKSPVLIRDCVQEKPADPEKVRKILKNIKGLFNND